MVGFNRRFAPMVIRAKALIDTMGEPKSLIMTVNAGAVPREHWTQDPLAGGGRILGEACHFIDLLRHLVGAPVGELKVASMLPPQGPADTAVISLHFLDGSIGAINYFANGHRSVAKERLEIYCGGRMLMLDNYRRLTAHGWPRGAGMRAWRQDKGQAGCVKAFLDAVRSGGPAPIPWDEIAEVSRLAIEAANRA